MDAARKSSPGDAEKADLKGNTAAVNTPKGPALRAYDEIYILKNVDRANMRVLLSLDKHPDDGSKEANTPGEHMITWVKEYGKGKVFYTALGHRQEMWRDPVYQAHIVGGIRFALGLERGSAKPNK